MTGSSIVTNALTRLQDNKIEGISSSPYLMFKFSTRENVR